MTSEDFEGSFLAVKVAAVVIQQFLLSSSCIDLEEPPCLLHLQKIRAMADCQ
jgi:hypothetical protein